jgi:hypothetical protein
VRQGQIGADAAVEPSEPGLQGQGVGAPETIVAGPDEVDAGAFLGGPGGAGFQHAAGPVLERHDHGTQPFGGGLFRRRQGDAHTVIDAGVQQAALKFADLVGVIPVAFPPRRQGGDPGLVGSTRPRHQDAVQQDRPARHDAVFGRDGEGGVIHHDAAGIGLGVCIAVPHQARDDPPFRRDHIDRPAWIAGLQPDRGSGVLGRLGVGGGVDPADGRRGQHEAATRLD